MILHTKKGISLIEVLLGAAIITGAMVTLVAMYNVYLRAAFQNTKTIQASLLIQEGIEAARLLRDQSWTYNLAPLSNQTNYYFSWNSGTSMWETTAVNTFTDSIFERKIVFSQVCRNSSDVIATCPASYTDTSIRLATVTVSWLSASGATTSLSVATYLTDLFSN